MPLKFDLAPKTTQVHAQNEASADATPVASPADVATAKNAESDVQACTLPDCLPSPQHPTLPHLLARFHGLHLQHELDNANQAKLKQELDELSPRLAKGEEYCQRLDPKDKGDKANAARAKLRELRKQREWLRLQIGDYQTSIDRAAVELADLEISARDAAGIAGAHICVVCFGLYVDWGQHQAECCPWEGQGKDQ